MSETTERIERGGRMAKKETPVNAIDLAEEAFTGAAEARGLRGESISPRAMLVELENIANGRPAGAVWSPAPGAESALLGITAKSSVSNAAEIATKAKKAGRAQRYAAQSVAREILKNDALRKEPGEYPGNVYRTCDCRWISHGAVGVNLSPQHQAAHYSGLVTCGSVWACPVCAAPIQERRRLEIEQAMTWAEGEGLRAAMVTFTFPHKSFNRLADLLERQAHAFRLLRQTSRWRKLKTRIGYEGLIRSLEVTHGDNGWHPHTHELWFIRPIMSDGLRLELVDLWQRACASAGLLDLGDAKTVQAFREHSVDIRLNATSGEYLAKQDDARSWGISHEIAKASSKAGKAKGIHPHHLLVRQGPGDAAKYLEYVQSMKGRRQLFWTPGLKERAGVGDISDEALAKEERERADLLALLPKEVWSVVRGNDARAELLDAAERGGLEAITLLLSSLGVELFDQPTLEPDEVRGRTPGLSDHASPIRQTEVRAERTLDPPQSKTAFAKGLGALLPQTPDASRARLPEGPPEAMGPLATPLPLEDSPCR